jgi:hypothetical protein
VTSSFRREIDEICALVGYCEACGGISLPTFWDQLPVPSSGVEKSKTILEDGTDMSRNFGKELPPYAALYTRRAQISSGNLSNFPAFDIFGSARASQAGGDAFLLRLCKFVCPLSMYSTLDFTYW